jgi:hypothetical protein
VADKYAAPLHIVHANDYFGHNLSGAAAGALPAAELATMQRSTQVILKAAEHAVRADFTDLDQDHTHLQFGQGAADGLEPERPSARARLQ